MPGQEARDDERDAKRLIFEVRMMLSSVASHGPHALTTTNDPMYTANLLRRLSNALEAATARKQPEPDPRDAEIASLRETCRILGDLSRELSGAVQDMTAKHPEPEITAREDMADFPVGTIARDMVGRVFIRTDAQTYRWRTIWGGRYDLSEDQVTTYTPVRILWVPVGEGEPADG
ncbi:MULTISPECIES: hypothetical protein [unclassified Microbacterium]|uniref:hypothetical protein n=1 Tax=unclassified Microbacterium TaxID=2609290 RepID=UPI003868A89E